MAESGLELTVDAAGNQIGRRPGAGSGPTLMIGSHLDTVEAGGRFDGIAGVLAGLEVARCLHAAAHRLAHPLEVVNFTCEEPSDFGLSTIGSRAMSGKLDAATAARLRDREGRSLAGAIDSVGGRGAALDTARRPPGDLARYLELHIEQSVSLDRAGVPVGVVTAIAAPSRYRVAIRGRQDHAGGTPMADRRDALAAAAELTLFVERLARAAGRGMVGTVGVLEARPNMINIVPGEADLLVDFRGIDPDAIAETLGRFEAGAAEIAARRGVTIDWTSLMRDAPLAVSLEMVEAAEAAARAVGRALAAPHQRSQPRREPRGAALSDRPPLHPVPGRPEPLSRGVGRRPAPRDRDPRPAGAPPRPRPGLSRRPRRGRGRPAGPRPAGPHRGAAALTLSGPPGTLRDAMYPRPTAVRHGAGRAR